MTQDFNCLEYHTRKLLGQLGEQLAGDYLVQKGMKINCRNFKSTRGEIDLIATDKQNLIFVEVKTRTMDDFVHPFELITPSKQKKICSAAIDYINEFGWAEEACRFDVIGVILPEGEEPRFEYIKGAFMMGGKNGF